MSEMALLRQTVRSNDERGGHIPALSRVRTLSGNLIAMIGSMDPLSLGRSCKTGIDHHLVDRVPGLSDDKLQM